MTKATTKYLFIASAYFFVFAAALGYGLYTIGSKSRAFELLQTEQQSSLQKEQSFLAINRIIEATEADRAELKAYFVTERDTISYITTIERMAAAVGVKLETTNLSIVPADAKQKTSAYLGAGFRVEGTKQAVDAFMYRMDNAPFKQVVTDMTISQGDGIAPGGDVSSTGVTDGLVNVQVVLMP